MAFTRRDMLARFGLIGGAGATLAATQMLGIASPASAKAADFALSPHILGRLHRARLLHQG